MFSRREFGTLALTGLPAALVFANESVFGAFAQAKPNSLIDGVQIGTITYSYRSMPDQSAEATLKYVVDSGISAIELMGGPVESFAGAPSAPGGGGRGPGGGRADGRSGGAPRARGVAAPAPAARSDATPRGATQPAGSWNGQACAAAAGDTAAGGARGGGRGRGEMTPEQQEHAAKLKAWRTSVSMDAFKKLRGMYNDAGVTIYAWKQLSPTMSDEELDYVFNVAEALGCTHTTLDLPTDAAQLKRIGDFAMKKKIYAAYHTHAQGSMIAFDQAFALSKGNMANIDFGHYVAAGNVGGSPMQFLQNYHDRIASYHLKDRTTPAHCSLNLPWGTGETPIREILQLVKKNKWRMPGTIEFEYDVPEGSDAVREVRKCLDYCRSALAS